MIDRWSHWCPYCTSYAFTLITVKADPQFLLWDHKVHVAPAYYLRNIIGNIVVDEAAVRL